MEWLLMLNRNPRCKLTEENIKPITNAYAYVNEIVSIIETADGKLKQERVDIENGLMEEIRKFQKEIEDVQGAVQQYAVKDYTTFRRA